MKALKQKKVSVKCNAGTLDFDAVGSLEELCQLAGFTGHGAWRKALQWAEREMPLLLRKFDDVKLCPKCDRPMSRYKEVRTEARRAGQVRLRYRCNPCENEYQRERQYARNPLRNKALGDLVMQQRGMTKAEKDKAKRERAHAKKASMKGWSRNTRLKYGLTLEQYVELLERQDYTCAMPGCNFKHRYEEWCALPSKRRGERGKPHHNQYLLCVDHCHLTGQVRSLLCNRCNVALGHIEEMLRNGVHVFSLYRYQQDHLTRIGFGKPLFDAVLHSVDERYRDGAA